MNVGRPSKNKNNADMDGPAGERRKRIDFYEEDDEDDEDEDVDVKEQAKSSKGSKSKPNAVIKVLDQEVPLTPGLKLPSSKGSKPNAVTEVLDSEVPLTKLEEVLPSSKGSASKNKSKKSTSPSKNSAMRRFTQKRARKTIGRFMKKTGSKRKAEFLKAICSDSGVCIAFGKERKKIFDFFKGFTQFEYLSGIKAIGTVSVNGFVKELEYTHKGYVAHAVLKSSQDEDSDNLMYEYFAGLQINDMATQLPCFVETYGHYEYKTNRDRVIFQREKSGLKDLSKMLTMHNPTEIKYSRSCENSINQCILIQHIKGAQSIGDKVYKGVPDHDFVMNDLLYVLYQVYICLAWKRNVFTHYDLHPDNVILYKPVDGKYIQFHYHLSDTVALSFKSQYITKMIDYGKSFVNNFSGSANSETYHTELCNTNECNVDPEECGDESGYGWLHYDSLTADNYYISSRLNNRSHDLRLLKDLWPNLPWHDEPLVSNVRIRTVLKNILGRAHYQHKYGTPPVVGKQDISGKIEDIVDAEFHIRHAMTGNEQRQANDDYYSGMSKLGDMHIYGNKPMNFIPAG
jgi:hypothetical protein